MHTEMGFSTIVREAIRMYPIPAYPVCISAAQRAWIRLVVMCVLRYDLELVRYLRSAWSRVLKSLQLSESRSLEKRHDLFKRGLSEKHPVYPIGARHHPWADWLNSEMCEFKVLFSP